MNAEKFEALFPKTSRHTRNRISLRHEFLISRGVAQDIKKHLTDDEADTMTLKEMVLAAKERSGFTDPNRPTPVRGYDTYFCAVGTLENFDAKHQAGGAMEITPGYYGEAYEAALAYRSQNAIA